MNGTNENQEKLQYTSRYSKNVTEFCPCLWWLLLWWSCLTIRQSLINL